MASRYRYPLSRFSYTSTTITIPLETRRQLVIVTPDTSGDYNVVRCYFNSSGSTFNVAIPGNSHYFLVINGNDPIVIYFNDTSRKIIFGIFDSDETSNLPEILNIYRSYIDFPFDESE